MLNQLFEPMNARFGEQKLKLVDGSCQYWYEDAWYNLIPTNNVLYAPYNATEKGTKDIAYYKFC